MNNKKFSIGFGACMLGLLILSSFGLGGCGIKDRKTSDVSSNFVSEEVQPKTEQKENISKDKKNEESKQNGEQENPLKENKEDETVYYIKGRNIYHNEGCSHIKGKEVLSAKKSEADKMGFSFCKDCEARKEKAEKQEGSK